MSEQCVFLCYGEGANGKSTLLELLYKLIGEYAHNLPFSAFEATARNGIPNDLAGLPSKRFVTANETSASTTLNEERIKSLTGGDITTARFLYGEHFHFSFDSQDLACLQPPATSGRQLAWILAEGAPDSISGEVRGC